MLVLYVREIEVTYTSLDPTTGEAVAEKFNTRELAEELGFSYVPMPEEYVVYRQKVKGGNGDTKPVHMHEMGYYVLCRVGDDGTIVNDYGGTSRNFNKPMVLDVATLRRLAALSGSRKRTKEPPQ